MATQRTTTNSGSSSSSKPYRRPWAVTKRSASDARRSPSAKRIGMRHRELEALLVVAHAELERELLLGVGEAMLAKPRARACLEVVEDRGQIAGRDVRKATDVARREFSLHVGDEEAESREDARCGRNDRERTAEESP